MTIKTPVRTTAIFTLVGAGIGLLGGLFGGHLGPQHFEEASKIFSEAAQSQMAQAGFFFTLAAWLHAGRVKKEIKANFEALTTAITQVAIDLRNDLSAHRARLDKLDTDVQSLKSKIGLTPMETMKNA